jgi:hypothetical protein
MRIFIICAHEILLGCSTKESKVCMPKFGNILTIWVTWLRKKGCDPESSYLYVWHCKLFLVITFEVLMAVKLLWGGGGGSK